MRRLFPETWKFLILEETADRRKVAEVTDDTHASIYEQDRVAAGHWKRDPETGVTLNREQVLAVLAQLNEAVQS